MSYSFGGLDPVLTETSLLQIRKRIQFDARQQVVVEFEGQQIGQTVQGRYVFELVVGQVDVAKMNVVFKQRYIC